MTTTYYIQITVGDEAPTKKGLKKGVLAYSDDGMIAVKLASGANYTDGPDGIKMSYASGHCYMRNKKGRLVPYQGLYNCLLSGTYTGSGSIIAITQVPAHSKHDYTDPRNPNNTGRPVRNTSN